MEIGNNIGVMPIKFDNHQSCDSLDKLIYQFNDLTYFYSKKPISYLAKQDLLSTIESIGKETAELAFSKHGIEPRREEFLKKMRETYKSLRNHPTGAIKKEDVDDVQKVINYCVSTSIKAKNGTTADMLKQLEINKKCYDIYIQPFIQAKLGVSLVLKNFCGIQREMLDKIKEKYELGE